MQETASLAAWRSQLLLENTEKHRDVAQQAVRMRICGMHVVHDDFGHSVRPLQEHAKFDVYVCMCDKASSLLEFHDSTLIPLHPLHVTRSLK